MGMVEYFRLQWTWLHVGSWKPPERWFEWPCTTISSRPTKIWSCVSSVLRYLMFAVFPILRLSKAPAFFSNVKGVVSLPPLTTNWPRVASPRGMAHYWIPRQRKQHWEGCACQIYILQPSSTPQHSRMRDKTEQSAFRWKLLHVDR